MPYRPIAIYFRVAAAGGMEPWRVRPAVPLEARMAWESNHIGLNIGP